MIASFFRSVSFAALAALAWIPFAAVLAPILGLGGARALYLAAVTVTYVAAIVPSAPRRPAAAILAALMAGLLLFAARTTGELAIGLAVLIAVARSAFLYAAPPARAIVREAFLIGGGLLFARFLGAYSLFSTALAIWGFLLVQSLLFLAPRSTRSARGDADLFEGAYTRASVLLDRSGV
ncbi:MAG: hypothetical protein ACREQQ_18840 [Candidatus Binatia bacterium]